MCSTKVTFDCPALWAGKITAVRDLIAFNFTEAHSLYRTDVKHLCFTYYSDGATFGRDVMQVI